MTNFTEIFPIELKNYILELSQMGPANRLVCNEWKEVYDDNLDFKVSEIAKNSPLFQLLEKERQLHPQATSQQLLTLVAKQIRYDGSVDNTEAMENKIDDDLIDFFRRIPSLSSFILQTTSAQEIREMLRNNSDFLNEIQKVTHIDTTDRFGTTEDKRNIPPEISHFTNLTSLFIPSSNTLPKELSSLSKLTNLRLLSNLLDTTVPQFPSVILKLNQLTHLTLHNMNLKKMDFSLFPNLRHLVVKGNLGKLKIDNLPRLMRLYISAPEKRVSISKLPVVQEIKLNDIQTSQVVEIEQIRTIANVFLNGTHERELSNDAFSSLKIDR